MGTVGLNGSVVPFNNLPGIGSPLSSVGVWQSPQRATLSTKYRPRANLGDPFGAADADIAEVARRIANMANPDAPMSFITSLSRT
jgi:hypothetical protein